MTFTRPEVPEFILADGTVVKFDIQIEVSDAPKPLNIESVLE